MGSFLTPSAWLIRRVECMKDDEWMKPFATFTIRARCTPTVCWILPEYIHIWRLKCICTGLEVLLVTPLHGRLPSVKALLRLYFQGNWWDIMDILQATAKEFFLVGCVKDILFRPSRRKDHSNDHTHDSPKRPFQDPLFISNIGNWKMLLIHQNAKPRAPAYVLKMEWVIIMGVPWAWSGWIVLTVPKSRWSCSSIISNSVPSSLGSCTLTSTKPMTNTF